MKVYGDNMPKHNAFLSAVNREVQRRLTESHHVHTQMCLDAAMIAANDVFKMGPTRCPDFAVAFSEALTEIAELTMEDQKDDKNLWYTKAKVDERLKQICGDHFQPWEERYK